MKTPKSPPRREMTSCPVCGHGLSAVDQVVCARDMDYQCRHCWSRVWSAIHTGSPMERMGSYATDRKKHAGAA